MYMDIYVCKYTYVYRVFLKPSTNIYIYTYTFVCPIYAKMCILICQYTSMRVSFIRAFSKYDCVSISIHGEWFERSKCLSCQTINNNILGSPYVSTWKVGDEACGRQVCGHGDADLPRKTTTNSGQLPR